MTKKEKLQAALYLAKVLGGCALAAFLFLATAWIGYFAGLEM